MHITFKTISGRAEIIDCDPTLSVAELKGTIAQRFGVDLERQEIKLLYAGNKLEDTTKIEEIGYKEGKFVIVHITKLKTAPPSPSSPQTIPTEAAPAPATPAQGTPEPATPAEAASEPATPQTDNTPAQPEPETPVSRHYIPANLRLANPETLDDHITEIMEMGFSENMAHRALLQTDNNVAQAVSLILTGHVIDAPLEAPPAPAGQQETANQPAAPLSRAERIEQARRRIRPEFPVVNERVPPGSEEQELVRNVITGNPQAAHRILMGHINERYPNIGERYEEDPSRLWILCGVPARPAGNGNIQIGNAVPAGAHRQQGRPQRSNPYTQEQNEAIRRIVAMGFSPEMVIQAYEACNRDEARAVNLLLSMT